MTTKPRKGSLLGLRDKAPAADGATGPTVLELVKAGHLPEYNLAPSRAGKKAMTGYFSPALSLAMRTTAMRHDMSLQDAMAEAMNDWLRKMGESPVGK